ncbi:SOS response-associated peptidase [Nocardioides jishulii]|uniref:Abasic site processing protein n=1 Tax=Nocardioides jishulii TaxID=2575440 RepID=A0A4U2YI79_9ACTN|nr:SOS response-associated peptidase [Nocardioides jishulii]QCX28103.1 SOS response-associated peptidase [Nocardioides jishulii]TKI60768.1 SOS response-associated peptidase [Nocardioides jishulii]
MCGRYASSRRPEDLVEEFEVVDNRVPAPLEADYNVAPTKEVYAVLERPPRTGTGTGADGDEVAPQRQLRTLTWGLVPSWAKDPSIASRMINARMETAAEKPAFRKAFRQRRCLLPADGYYEWYETSQVTKSGKPVKQPYFIRPRDGGVLAMAGLFEIWRDPDRPDDDPDRFRWTCTVLTTDAADDLGHIHDRMPLMVERERWDDWLDPLLTEVEPVQGLLVPAAPGLLEAYPVSRAVGNHRNNGPELVEPLPLTDAGDAGSGEDGALFDVDEVGPR